MSETDELIKLVRPWSKLLLGLLAAAIMVFAIRQLWPLLAWVLNVVSPFLVALVVAYVFHPIVTFVQRKMKLGRLTGIAVVAVGVLVLFGGLLGWLIPVLAIQGSAMLGDIRESVHPFFDRVLTEHLDEATREQIIERARELFATLDTSLREMVGQLGGAIKPVAQGGATAVKGMAVGVFSGLKAIGGFFGTLMFVVIITFYYLIDMDKIPEIIRTLLPEKHRERIWEMGVKADKAVGGFLRGQLTACTLVGLAAAVGLYVIGLKQYAILIGFFAGLFNFVPYLGPVMGAAPAVLWALFTKSLEGGDERFVTVLLIVGLFVLIQMLDGFVFQPYIVGGQASLHPLAVMLALLVGAQAGLGGMIVAVPVACIVKVAWVELVWKPKREAMEAGGGG